MRILAILILIILYQNTFAQKKVEDFGYTHHQIEFQSDTVDFIIKSTCNTKVAIITSNETSTLLLYAR